MSEDAYAETRCIESRHRYQGNPPKCEHCGRELREVYAKQIKIAARRVRQKKKLTKS